MFKACRPATLCNDCVKSVTRWLPSTKRNCRPKQTQQQPGIGAAWMRQITREELPCTSCLWPVWHAAADAAAACLCRVQAFVQGVEEGHELEGNSVCWSGWTARLGVPHSGSSSDHRRQGRRQHQSGRKNNSRKKKKGKQGEKRMQMFTHTCTHRYIHMMM